MNTTYNTIKLYFDFKKSYGAGEETMHRFPVFYKKWSVQTELLIISIT